MTPPDEQQEHVTESSQFVPYTGTAVLEAMTEAKNYNEFLVDLIVAEEPDRGARVLDFGAGLGTFADMMRGRGYNPDCAEVDEELCQHLTAKGYNVATDVGTLEPRSYDLIYTLNVMEHIENDFDTVKQLSGLLAPGGRILIYVPASQVLYSAFDRLVGHYRRYDRARLRNIASASDLTVKELRYCDPLGWLAAFAYKLIGDKEGELTPRSVATYDRFVFPLSRRLEPIFGQGIGKNVLLVAEYRAA
jgi:SAM-dependent methyltransferase